MAKHFPFIAAASVEVVADGAPKRRVQLLPLGVVALRDGRGPFRLADRAAAEAVVSATRQRAGRTAIVIDYDHQTHFGAREGVGGQAPAAGWIDPASLAVQDDGIWGDVEWTEAAARRLAAREYRYLSPLFSYDESTGAVVAIINAGLTNTPAIEALAAVASTQSKPENMMSFAKIAAALGLAAAATEEECLVKISALVEGASASATALAAASRKLGLKDATLDAVIAAATTVDPEKYVPAAVVSDLTARLAKLEGEQAEAIVAAAQQAGKITPSQREFWLGRMKAAPEETAAYLATATPVIAAGAVLDGNPGKAAGALTDTEAAVARAMGMTTDQYQGKK